MELATIGVLVSGVTPGANPMITGNLLTIVEYHIMRLGVFAAVTSDPVQKPEDPITTWALENIGLEYGAAAGVGLFGVGTVIAVSFVIEWAASGYVVLPFTALPLAAFTAIVIGLQTVFSSFFLSTVQR